MAEYTDLINTLRDFWNDGTDDIRNEATDAIEELQAAKCPHYIRNIHNRGDDSLCEKWGCEVKEVQPVRHGRWMHEYDEDWFGGGRTYCTNCGQGYADGAFHEVDEFNFCPNCGARMEAGDEN